MAFKIFELQYDVELLLLPFGAIELILLSRKQVLKMPDPPLM